MNTDVLAWWKLRDHNEAADPSTGRPEGLPHLARMVRQWLGAPATSAGVERLFSKAGSMHHDLKGSMEDGSLEHSLIATANRICHCNCHGHNGFAILVRNMRRGII